MRISSLVMVFSWFLEAFAHFNAELLRIILKANKNYSNGLFSAYIRDNGRVLVIKLEFETETGIKTKYQINNTIK